MSRLMTPSEEEALKKRKEKFRLAQSKTVEGGIECSFQARFPRLEPAFWNTFYEACSLGENWRAHKSLLISHSLPQTINSKDEFVREISYWSNCESYTCRAKLC
jgi:hypothetical protein